MWYASLWVRLFIVAKLVVTLMLKCTSFVTVEMLAKTGAKMVIISNSSRRASVTSEKMRNLGFDPSLFLGSITSGELTHQYLERLSIFNFVVKPFSWRLI